MLWQFNKHVGNMIRKIAKNSDSFFKRILTWLHKNQNKIKKIVTRKIDYFCLRFSDIYVKKSFNSQYACVKMLFYAVISIRIFIVNCISSSKSKKGKFESYAFKTGII